MADFVNNRHIGQRIVCPSGTELHLLMQGQGQPVVFLHGFLQSLYTWRGIAPLLADSFRLIMPDLPGAGYSDSPEVLYGIDDHVAMLHELLDTLDLGPVHLVGTGMGGSYALAFAASFPAKVQKLVSISPGGVGRNAPWRIRMLAKPWIGDFFGYYLREKHIEDYLLRAYFDETRVNAAMVEQTWLPLLMPGTREAQIGYVRDFREHSLAGQLHTIAAPTLLVWGEHDNFHPRSERLDYENQMQHIQSCVINHSGFMVQEERSTELAAKINTFLREPYP